MDGDKGCEQDLRRAPSTANIGIAGLPFPLPSWLPLKLIIIHQ